MNGNNIYLQIILQNAESKLLQIRELADKSKGNVITLDDATYSYYAISKPRTYSLIVFLTASHPKFKCSICKRIDSELMLLAESYSKLMENNKEQKNVFFLRLDYESSQKVFQSYAVTSVPMLFYLAPQSGSEKPEVAYQVSARDRYQVPPEVDAESLANFLQDRTNVSVKIQRSMVGSYVALLIVFGILAALVQPVINSMPFWLRILQWKPLWIAVSFGVYTCAISGLIFDIIRTPPM